MLGADRPESGPPLPAGGSAGGASRAFVGVIVFAVTAAWLSRVPLLPDIGRDLSLSAASLGVLAAAFGLGRLLMDLPAGRLAGVVSPRAALAGAAASLAVGLAVVALSGSLVVALAGAGLVGAGSALTNTTGMLSFATATGAAGRGASMAMFSTALLAGQAVGPGLAGLVASAADWRAALGLAALLGLCVATMSFLTWLRTDRPAGNRSARHGPPARSPDRPARHGPPERSLDRAARQGPPARSSEPEVRDDPEGPATNRPEGLGFSTVQLGAIALIPFAIFFAIGGLYLTLIPLVGARELGLSPSVIGLALAAAGLVRFLGAWAGGLASDRFSRRRALVPGLLAMTAGAALLAVPATTFWWSASIFLIAGSSYGVAVGVSMLADRVPREALGPRLGAYRLAGDAGLVAGPVVAGLLYGELGAGPAGAAAALILLAAAVVTGAVGQPPRREPPDSSGGLAPEEGSERFP